MLDSTDLIIRFSVTFFLSLLFGLERQRSHKPIGFGTYIFVSMGSCALAVTAITLDPENPLPLLGAIVTGIGFLGAGALIRTSDKIFGFTSAASIWIFAIFGLVIGVGEYIIGTFVYAAVIIIMIFDRFLEHRSIGSYQKKIIITTNKIMNEKEISSLLSAGKNKLMRIELNKKNHSMVLEYVIQSTKEDLNSIPQRLVGKEWFDSFKVE